MIARRHEHAAVRLMDGRVLVVGGWSFGPAGEIWDPATGEWTGTGSLTYDRFAPSATLLADGRVLVAGGGNYGAPRSTAEIYDPATNLWTRTTSLSQGRRFHSAVLLNTGEVLVVGGFDADGDLHSAEVYDPVSGRWYDTGWTEFAYSRAALHVLASGEVVISGNITSERYDRALNAPPWVSGLNVPTLRTGAMGTTSVPVHVRWFGVDPDGDGVATYEIEQSRNFNNFTALQLSNPGSTSATVSLPLERIIQHRVRATDGLGLTGGYSYSDLSEVVGAQEIDAVIAYSGNWFVASVNGAFGGQVAYTSKTGNEATFNFQGSSAGWVTTRYSNRGIAEVFVDGVSQGLVDLFASTLRARQVAFVVNGLDPNVPHTMTIVVTGLRNPLSTAARIDLDGFVVIEQR
jgi:hypothetical protein